MDKELTQIWAGIETIKVKLAHSNLEYDEAKKLAKPLIDKLNERGEVVAKRFKKQFKPFTFTGIFR